MRQEQRLKPLVTAWGLVKEGPSITRISGMFSFASQPDKYAYSNTSTLTGQNGDTVQTRSGSEYVLGSHKHGGIREWLDKRALKKRVPEITNTPAIPPKSLEQ